jgi:hypothetical protein
LETGNVKLYRRDETLRRPSGMKKENKTLEPLRQFMKHVSTSGKLYAASLIEKY